MAWIVGLIAAIAAIVAAVVWRPLRRTLLESQLERARREFHRQRERLEARFLDLAAASGKPRGLRWTDCDFDDDVSYARDRKTGQLSAFVAVNISFEAVAGGGMEHVEAVGDIRAATAVFQFRRGRWETFGRALFNLNPTQALERYQSDFIMVAQELARS